MTILKMCLECGRCGCLGNPCKPQRKAPVRKLKPSNSGELKTRIDKDISKFPPHIQAQIKAKLTS